MKAVYQHVAAQIPGKPDVSRPYARDQPQPDVISAAAKEKMGVVNQEGEEKDTEHTAPETKPTWEKAKGRDWPVGRIL